MADNVRGELSAHVITVSKLNRKKIARPIECAGHDAQSAGIINMPDVARCGHSQRVKIDWPPLRPCATTWAIMRQTVYLPIKPCLSATYPALPGQEQRFARVRGLRDAELRAAKVIADNIRSRLASYFIAGT